MDEAVIAATLGLLAELGYAGLTLAEVACRAGVRKPAVYRRWAERSRLVVEAMVSRLPAGVLPDTGSTTGDLLAYTEQVAATLTQTPATRPSRSTLYSRASVPRQHAELELTYTVDALTIAVHHPVEAAPGPAVGASPRGHGLIGMRERAAACGRSLTVRRDGGTFCVDAVIPYRPTGAATSDDATGHLGTTCGGLA